MKKRLLICSVLLQFVVLAFAQSINAPKVAEKLFPTTKQNVKTTMQSLGFKNIKIERKMVDAAGRVLTVCGGDYNGIVPRCEVYFSDKRTPDFVLIQYNEYQDETTLYGYYEKAGYTLIDHQIKPAHMNKERRNRAILTWAKKTNNGKTIKCISEIADAVHDDYSITMIDLGSYFFIK